jgi:hypothetical protein
VNESEKSEGYLAIIIKAKNIFQKQAKKRTWKIPYVLRRKGREETCLYRTCHLLYGIMDRKKEKEYNDESYYNTVEFYKNF